MAVFVLGVCIVTNKILIQKQDPSSKDSLDPSFTDIEIDDEPTEPKDVSSLEIRLTTMRILMVEVPDEDILEIESPDAITEDIEEEYEEIIPLDVLGILQESYMKGDITKDEYEYMKKEVLK